jgi:hypothetical protein
VRSGAHAAALGAASHWRSYAICCCHLRYNQKDMSPVLGSGMVQIQAVARCDDICHYACSSPAEQLSWSAEIDTKVWGKSMLNVRVYTVSTSTGFVQAGGVQQGPDAPAALDLARLSYLVDPLHHMSAVTERPGCYAAPLIPCFRWGQAFLMKCAAAVLPLLSLCWLLVEQLLAASICPTPMFTCPDDHVGVAVADRQRYSATS